MTLKLKIAERQSLQLKVLPRYPVDIIGDDGIVVTTVGGSKVISLEGGGPVTSFNTRTGAVIPNADDYAISDITGLTAALAAKAALASPVFTGNPTAPTPTLGDDDTSIATTAFVVDAIAASGAGLDGLFDITAFGAVGDVVFLADGVITATDATVTSATGGFTGQSGKTIIIGDADSVSSGTVTIDLGTDIFTLNSHGFTVNNTVIFTNSGGALPTGITAGTRYFVRDDTANTFKIATAKGGPAVDVSGSQSGTHTVTRLRALKTTISSVNSDTSIEVGSAPTVSGTGRAIQFGTDSSSAINDAIDACEAAGGGWVFVPPVGIFQAMDINLAERGGTKFGGLVWGCNQDIASFGIGRGSILVPTQGGNLLDCVGSSQIRIEDIQLGDTRSPVTGGNAILLANSTTRFGDAFELRNVFVTGMWAAAPLNDYGVTADITNCRFWNYAGSNTSWAALFTRDNVYSQASTHATIATATTGNPNCSIYDTEFHNFTALATPLGAIRLRGAVGISFETCLIDSADTVNGTMLLETAGSAANTVQVKDCTFYSESTGPVANAASITCNTASTWYETGENTYVAVTKVNGSAVLTYNSGITPAAKVLGTATNDAATAGYIGQIVESTVLSGAAVSGTNGVTVDITSISLTAGDWDVWGQISTTVNGATVTTGIEAWIHTVSATRPTVPNGGAYIFMSVTFATGQPMFQIVGQRRISVASTTTVYLSASPGFNTNTLALYGYIGARRVR